MFGEKYIIFYFCALLLNVYRMLCIPQIRNYAPNMIQKRK